MVLHDVAQCASAIVVVTAAAWHALLFGNRDLHRVDVLAIPQRLEDGVVKAPAEQVLHGLFAEVVVDTINLSLAQRLAQLSRQPFGAVGVMAEWFLDDDTAKALARLSQEPSGAEVGYGPGEQLGLDRKVEQPPRITTK